MSSTYYSKPFAQPNIDDEDYEDCYNIRKSTSEEVTTLQQLKEKLDATPLESKSSLVYAQQVNVDLVNDDHLLLFLYAEGFNVDVSRYSCNCPMPVQSYTSDPACIGNIYSLSIRMLNRMHWLDFYDTGQKGINYSVIIIHCH